MFENIIFSSCNSREVGSDLTVKTTNSDKAGIRRTTNKSLCYLSLFIGVCLKTTMSSMQLLAFLADLAILTS